MRGFLMGALVGAVAAVLVAPRRGEETREMLRSRAEVWQEQVMSKLDAARADVESLRGEMMTRLDEVMAQFGGRAGQGPITTAEGPTGGVSPEGGAGPAPSGM